MKPDERLIILREIKRWQAESLLPDEMCQRLLETYAEPLSPEAPQQVLQARQPAEAGSSDNAIARRPSFSQMMVSETAVNTALYLGGFFILVAAFIIAALVASARLPILIAATLIFLGGSFFTLRRLPKVSLVLYLIGSTLIPIDAQVISGLIDLHGRSDMLYWALIYLLATFIWAGGYLLFRSWLFSSLSFLAAGLTMYLTSIGLDLDAEWSALLLSGVMLVALLLAVWQRERFGRSLTLPLLILSQIGEFLILCLVFLQFLYTRISPSSWLLLASIWLLAALYYTISDWLVRRKFAVSPFPFAAVFCLGVFPLVLSGALSPEPIQVAWLAFAWGLLLSIAAEWFWRREKRVTRTYSLAFFLSGAMLFAGAVISQVIREAFIPGEIFLLVFGIFYLALHVRKPRWWLWTSALLVFSMAYFNLFLSGPFKETSFSPGYIFLIPAMFCLSLELLVYRGLLFHPSGSAISPRQRISIWLPTLVFGGFYVFLDLIVLLNNPREAWTAQIFLVYALFFAAYAVFRSKPLLGALSTGSLALALFYLLLYLEIDKLLAPLLLLAVVYYLVGLGMFFLKRTRLWSAVILWSGLGLGSLVSLFAPISEDSFAILGATLIALFYTVEGWRRRSAWYGLPACLIFYLAYLTALLQLNIHQPQYYAIAAAVLGIIMHNIFLRSKNRWAAFICGVIAILILLSTTFVQMVQSEELRYFLLLFIEALLLLGYGLVMRSRSFFFLPIVYLVLATIVVVTTVLSGVPTALIIGCTGLLLLSLGILALVMRDRLVKVSEQVGERFNIW